MTIGRSRSRLLLFLLLLTQGDLISNLLEIKVPTAQTSILLLFWRLFLLGSNQIIGGRFLVAKTLFRSSWTQTLFGERVLLFGSWFSWLFSSLLLFGSRCLWETFSRRNSLVLVLESHRWLLWLIIFGSECSIGSVWILLCKLLLFVDASH